PRSSAMSIDVALSTRRGVGRDTYSLPKKNAATPQVARQWTCHHYIKDTYSLPQKRGCAPVPCQWTWHYYAAFLRNVKRVCILRRSDGKVYL
ncbi:MAG: hypothetical protein MSS47_06635, partial [Bacteroidales bacterium]|nr:hypothetical protein [Bacteroidales bacterium]